MSPKVFAQIFLCSFFSPTNLDYNFFVQNVFLKILFPNFYSNFFFIFNVCNIFGQKILIQTFVFLFFSSIFSLFHKVLCANFFLEFLLCHKFWFQFLSKIYSESFWTKKLIQTFCFISFLLYKFVYNLHYVNFLSFVTNIIGGAYQAWELDESMHIAHALE